MLEQGFVSIKQNGYRNTSIADIAKAAGVAKGTFYNFFSSKEQFVAEIMEHRRIIIPADLFHAWVEQQATKGATLIVEG